MKKIAIIYFLLAGYVLCAQPAFTLIEDPLLQGSGTDDMFYGESTGFLTDGHDIYYSSDAVNWAFHENAPIQSIWISGIASLDGHIFLAAGGDIYKYNAGADEWNPLSGVQDAYADGIHAAGDLLLAVYNPEGNEDRYIYYSDNYGQTWTLGALLAGGYHEVLDFSDTYLFLLDEEEDELLYTSDGVTLTSMDFTAIGGVDDVMDATYYMDAEESTDYFYFAYQSSTVYRYDMSDESWTDITPTGISFDALVGLNACDAMVYTAGITMGGDMSIDLISSDDQGDTWSVNADPGIGSLPIFDYLYQYSASGIFGTSAMYDNYQSSDGINFSSSNSGLYAQCYNILANDNAIIYGSDAIGLVRSTDAGSWTTSNAGIPVFFEDYFWVVDIIQMDGVVFASVVDDPMMYMSSLYRSTDNGQNWTEVTEHSSDDYFVFAGTDGEYVYLKMANDDIIGYNADASSSINVTNSISSLNQQEIYSIKGDGSYTYLFTKSPTGFSKSYFSDNNGSTWTEISINGNVDFVFYKDGHDLMESVSVAYAPDGKPVFPAFDHATQNMKLYKLDTEMETWEDMGALGLPNDYDGILLQTGVQGREYAIVTTNGVSTSSDMTSWEAYGANFRNGADIVNAGMHNDQLIIGTNGSGIWKIDLEPLAAETRDMLKTAVYPNPSSDKWEVSLPVEGSKKLRLVDIQGRCIASYQTEDMKQTIPAGTLDAGVYFLSIDTDMGSKVVKLVKN